MASSQSGPVLSGLLVLVGWASEVRRCAPTTLKQLMGVVEELAVAMDPVEATRAVSRLRRRAAVCMCRETRSSCGDSLDGGRPLKCKIKMSKFCVYDELECLQLHTNLYVSQVFQKAHSARKTLYISVNYKTFYLPRWTGTWTLDGLFRSRMHQHYASTKSFFLRDGCNRMLLVFTLIDIWKVLFVVIVIMYMTSLKQVFKANETVTLIKRSKIIWKHLYEPWQETKIIRMHLLLHFSGAIWATCIFKCDLGGRFGEIIWNTFISCNFHWVFLWVHVVNQDALLTCFQFWTKDNDLKKTSKIFDIISN